MDYKSIFHCLVWFKNFVENLWAKLVDFAMSQEREIEKAGTVFTFEKIRFRRSWDCSHGSPFALLASRAFQLLMAPLNRGHWSFLGVEAVGKLCGGRWGVERLSTKKAGKHN